MTKTASTETASGGTTYTAGDGLELSGTEFTTDLKANGGLVIESSELAVDLAASSIRGTLAVADGGTGATSASDAREALGLGTGDDVRFNTINVAGPITGDTSLTLDSTTVTTAELGVLTGVTPGDVAGGKALVLDSNKDLNDTTEVIRALRINSFGVGTSPTIITGDITYSAALKAPAGSVGSPSITYSSDTNTGIYFPGAENVAISIASSKKVDVLSTGLDVTGDITCSNDISAENDISAVNDISAGNNISAVGDITAYSSDKRLKTNIVPIQEPLSKLSTISGYTYRWNIDKCNKVGFKPQDTPEVGVLAQEINEIMPEVIKPAPFDRDKYGNSASGDNYLTVQYEKIVPLLIECIKEQQSQIDELKVCLSKLK